MRECHTERCFRINHAFQQVTASLRPEESWKVFISLNDRGKKRVANHYAMDSVIQSTLGGRSRRSLQPLTARQNLKLQIITRLEMAINAMFAQDVQEEWVVAGEQ